MKSTLAAALAAVAAAPLALIPAAAPAHAASIATVCHGTEGVCLDLPGGWTMARENFPAYGEVVGVFSPKLTVGGWMERNVTLQEVCDRNDPNWNKMWVMRTTKTSQKDARGMTLFAVQVIKKYGVGYYPETFLTAHPGLRSGGLRNSCDYATAAMIASPKGGTFTVSAVNGAIERDFPSRDKAYAALSNSESMAFYNALIKIRRR